MKHQPLFTSLQIIGEYELIFISINLKILTSSRLTYSFELEDEEPKIKLLGLDPPPILGESLNTNPSTFSKESGVRIETLHYLLVPP